MTPSQLYALELAARRARSQEIARLLSAGAKALQAGASRVLRVIAAKDVKGVRHA